MLFLRLIFDASGEGGRVAGRLPTDFLRENREGTAYFYCAHAEGNYLQNRGQPGIWAGKRQCSPEPSDHFGTRGGAAQFSCGWDVERGPGGPLYSRPGGWRYKFLLALQFLAGEML